MEIDVPANVVRVRLLLTVSRTGVRTGSRPSANIDCDECVYCRDKPRLGGPGTKRQKCVLKRSPTARVRLQVHVPNHTRRLQRSTALASFTKLNTGFECSASQGWHCAH